MPRWEPDARKRLVAAALDLFSERGYDETTVAELAERAGVTKSTFFRYFPDKRDVLAAGQETLARLLAQGVLEAPPDATPLAAVASGLDRLASQMTSYNREIGPRLGAIISTNAELQARHQLKHVGLVAAVADALRTRGASETQASLAAEMGLLAFKNAYAHWIQEDSDRDFAELARESLDDLRRELAALD